MRASFLDFRRRYRAAVRLSLLAIALCPGLLGCEDTEPDAPALPPAAVWTGVRSEGDLRFVNLRRPGVDQLLIYAGRSRNGTTELSEAGAALLAGGFDLISHAPAPASPDEQPAAAAPRTVSDAAPRNTLNDDELRRFLELALSRPGYRRRVLVLHGRHLPIALSLLTAMPSSVSLSIVLRPGEALSESRRLLQAIQRSDSPTAAEPLRLLWAPGPGVEANRLRALLERAAERAPLRGDTPGPRLRLERLPLPGLSSRGATGQSGQRPAEPDGFRLQLTERLEFELLLLRVTPRWQPLIAVFPRGCAYSAGGPRFRAARAIQISGPRDSDFCPLFLRWPGQPLFRAEVVTPDSCVYRVADGRTRLYCDSAAN